MAKQKFNMKYDRVRLPVLDKVQRESRVDLTGYISKDRRVKYLIEAGERLKYFGMFDVQDEDIDIDDMDCDPTRSGNFDLADASKIANYIKSKKSKKVQDDDLESHQTAQEGPGSVSRSEPGQLTPEVSEEVPGEAGARGIPGEAGARGKKKVSE